MKFLSNFLSETVQTLKLSSNICRSKVASTHGDHTVKVFDIRTGRLLNSLEGHKRTAWCASFHPYLDNIIASGCLSGQIRVWDLHVSFYSF